MQLERRGGLGPGGGGGCLSLKHCIVKNLEEVVDVGQPSSWLLGLVAAVAVPYNCTLITLPKESRKKSKDMFSNLMVAPWVNRGCSNALY